MDRRGAELRDHDARPDMPESTTFELHAQHRDVIGRVPTERPPSHGADRDGRTRQVDEVVDHVDTERREPAQRRLRTIRPPAIPDLEPHRCRQIALQHRDRSYRSIVDESPESSHRRSTASVVPDLQDDACLLRGSDGHHPLTNTQRQWLLDEDVLPGGRGGADLVKMRRVRSGDEKCIDPGVLEQML